jgi:hypothetical protein
MIAISKITGKGRIDRVRGQDMRKQCESQEKGKWVRKFRKEWNNHISKMTPGRKVQIVTDDLPKGRKG